VSARCLEIGASIKFCPLSAWKGLRMTRYSLLAIILPLALMGLFLHGCADESPNDVYRGAEGATSKASPDGGPGQAARSNPKIKEVMVKVGRGPQALQGTLGDALKQADPAWDIIQSKSQEFAQLASELPNLEPARGTKESWSKLTLAFAESATELQHAAQAKDMNKTREAFEGLGGSCMACHRQHRMGPGMGGPPGGRGMGPPPGGPGEPPQGGPGGSPR
jgi:cytochrome c556